MCTSYLHVKITNNIENNYEYIESKIEIIIENLFFKQINLIHVYILYYIPNIYFFYFPTVYIPRGIFCSPSVWNWWVLTKRVDDRGNENSISLFPVCGTKQKSGWIYPDRAIILRNRSFFFPSTFVEFSSFVLRLETNRKKNIDIGARENRATESWWREGARRKRENSRGIFNVGKINERATLCKLWQGLITWRRAVIRSTCFPEFSVKNLDVV